jgi:hypothetical protein
MRQPGYRVVRVRSFPDVDRACSPSGKRFSEGSTPTGAPYFDSPYSLWFREEIR